MAVVGEEAVPSLLLLLLLLLVSLLFCSMNLRSVDEICVAGWLPVPQQLLLLLLQQQQQQQNASVLLLLLAALSPVYQTPQLNAFAAV